MRVGGQLRGSLQLRDVPRLGARPQFAVQRARRAHRLRRQRRRSRRGGESRGDDGVGVLLPDARSAAGARPPARARRRRDDRRSPRRGARSPVLDHATRRRLGRAESADRRERAAADRRRRRAARFRGDHAGHPADDLRAVDDAWTSAERPRRLREPDELLAVRLRAPAAGRHPRARRACGERDLPTDPVGSGGPAPGADERGQDGAVPRAADSASGRAARPSSCAPKPRARSCCSSPSRASCS